MEKNKPYHACLEHSRYCTCYVPQSRRWDFGVLNHIRPVARVALFKTGVDQQSQTPQSESHLIC